MSRIRHSHPERSASVAPARRPGTRRSLTLVAAIAAVLAMSGVLTSCETTEADRVATVALINADRAANGIAPVRENAKLNQKADQWASAMRDRCQISHSRLADGTPPDWRILTENVGRGGSIEQVHVAYMNSPGHRGNVLDTRVDQVGVGAVTGTCNGQRTWFTVHVFMEDAG